MNLLYISHDYSYWSKILLGLILTSAYHLEVKVTDLEKFYVKVIKISSFLNSSMDLR